MTSTNPYAQASDLPGKMDEAPAYSPYPSIPVQTHSYNPYCRPTTKCLSEMPTIEDLPPGWMVYWTEEGCPYYFNFSTQQTQWQNPKGTMNPEPSPPQPPPPAFNFVHESVFQEELNSKGDKQSQSRDKMQAGIPLQNSSTNDLQASLKPRPLHLSLPLTLEQMFNGCSQRIRIKRQVIEHNSSPNVPSQHLPRLVAATKTLEVPIRAGLKAGTRITYENEGDQDVTTGLFADLVFTLVEKKHQQFKRVHDDFIVTIPLTLSEASNGYKGSFTNLNGKRIRIDTGILVLNQENNKIVVVGEGFPNPRKGPGDFVVEFNLELPLYPLLNAESQNSNWFGWNWFWWVPRIMRW